MQKTVDHKALIDDYLSGKTVDAIAAKFNISVPTLYKILSKHNIPKKTTKPAIKVMGNKTQAQKRPELKPATEKKPVLILTPKKEEKNISIIYKRTIEFAGKNFTFENMFPVSACKTVDCNMISNRHDNNIIKAIFEGPIDPTKLEDYEWQEAEIRKFITANMTKGSNGKYNETLVVFVSGMQMILASIIKVCMEDHVSLSLKHWNPDKKKYQIQNIITDTNSKKLNLYSKIDGEIFVYGMTQDEFEKRLEEDNNFTPYVVCINDHVGVDSSFNNCRCIICNPMDAWKMYPAFVEQMMDQKTKHSVSLSQLDLHQDSLSFYKRISRSFNFKSEFKENNNNRRENNNGESQKVYGRS